MGFSPVAVLYNANGNPVTVVADGGVYRLSGVNKVLNSSGSQVDPATEGTLAGIDAVLDAIKDTAGIKKITDALPAGTNEIGRVRGFLYDDVNQVAMALAPEVAIPANTRGLLWLGEGADGKAYAPRVSDSGKVSVSSSPPEAPPGTTSFVIDASSPLEVGPNPVYDESNGPVIASGYDVHVQFFAAGAAGDPSEKGSKVELYWEEGAGPTRHLVERIYVAGATVALSMPNTNLTRDGTAMAGNGTNTRLVVRRERLATSAQEIDAVVRGYTEASS